MLSIGYMITVVLLMVLSLLFMFLMHGLYVFVGFVSVLFCLGTVPSWGQFGGVPSNPGGLG